MPTGGPLGPSNSEGDIWNLPGTMEGWMDGYMEEWIGGRWVWKKRICGLNVVKIGLEKKGISINPYNDQIKMNKC